MFYKDFFESPARIEAPNARRLAKPTVDGPSTGKVRFHEEDRVKKIKPKGKNLPVNTMFYDEEENEDEDDDYEGEEGAEIDDDDEDEGMGEEDSEENSEGDEEDVSMG